MKVSVITPTYNRKGLLRETINSFLMQDYENKEMIIVDDGGTDGTESMISEFRCKNRETSIQYHRKKNGGISSAYNYGLDLAKGDLICVMQDDDLFFNHASISSRVSVFEFFNRGKMGADYEIEVIWTSAQDICEDGSAMKIVPALPVNVMEEWKSDRIYTETMLWRKSIHDRIGKFYMNSNEDWDFKIRCLMECNCLSIPWITSAKYRRWGGQASHNNKSSGLQARCEKEMRERLKQRYWMVCK